MSLEDKNIKQVQQSTAQELPKKEDKETSWGEKYIYGEGEKSLWSNVKENWEESPLSIITDVGYGVGNVYDLVAGDDKEQREASQKIDNYFGGLSNVGDMLFKDESISLSKQEDDRTNKIMQYQKEKEIWSPLETIGITGGPEYIKGNQEELYKELGAFEETSKAGSDYEKEYQETVKDKYDDLIKRQNKEFNDMVSAQIKKEISEYKLSSSLESKQRRREEIKGEIETKVIDKFRGEWDEYAKGYNSFLNKKRNDIATRYVKPQEGKNAYETYANFESDAAGKATDDLIRKEVIQPEKEKLMKEFKYLYRDHDKDKDGGDLEIYLEKVADVYFEKRMRDEKHYYESLAITKDPKERAKMKSVLFGQKTARSNYFRGIMTEFHKQSQESRSKGGTKPFDDILKDAYKTEFDKMSEWDKSELLKREGTDIAASMYYNNIEMRKRIGQMNNADGVVDTIKYFGAAVGNGIQQAFSGADMIFGALVGSNIAQVNPVLKKDTDFKKVYGDEYELMLANTGVIGSLATHITYNVDDLAEVVFGLGKLSKANIVTGKIDKVSKMLRKQGEIAKQADIVKPLLSLNKAKRLTITGAKGLTYGARGLSETLAGSAIVDRHLRTVDTDANAVVNLVSDTFFEPFMAVLGAGSKFVGETARVKGATSAVKHLAELNPYYDAVTSFLTGDENMKDLALGLVEYEAKKGNAITEKDARSQILNAQKLVQQVGDLGKLSTLFKGDKDALIKVISEEWDSIKSNYKKGANKTITLDGAISKMLGFEERINASLMETDKIFRSLKTANPAGKIIMNRKLEKDLVRIKGLINGYGQLNQARLEFSRSDKKKHLETFTKKIDEINNTKDIDQKQTLTRQLYQDLHRLQNSSSNKGVKPKDQLTFFNPVTKQKITIDVDKIEKLSQGKQDELLSTEKLIVTEEDKKILGVEEGELVSISKHSMLNKMEEVKSPKDFHSIFEDISKSPKEMKKPLGSGYNSGEKDGYNSSNIIDLQEDLEHVFGEGNINTIDLGTTPTNRNEISNILSQQDNYISFAHGRMVDPKTKKERSIFYIGVGKKIGEMFDISFNNTKKIKTKDGKIKDVGYLEYHKKSNKIIDQLLTAETIDDGLKQYYPAQTVNNFDLNIDDYVMNIFRMEDKISQTGYIQDRIVGKSELTETGKEVMSFIKEQIKFFNIEDNAMNQFYTRAFASKIIDNYELFKEIHKNDTIKTKEDVYQLAEGLLGDKTEKVIIGEFYKQFNTSNFTKESEKLYELYIRELEFERGNLEIELGELEHINTISNFGKKAMDPSKDVNRIEIERVKKEIEAIDNILSKDKEIFINQDSYKRYTESMDKYLKDYLYKTLATKGKMKADLYSVKKTKEIVEDIKDLDTEIEEYDFAYVNKDNSKEVQIKKDKLNKLKANRKEKIALLKEVETEVEKEMKTLKGDKEKLSTEIKAQNKEIDLKVEDFIKTHKQIELKDLHKFIENNESILNHQENLDHMFELLKEEKVHLLNKEGNVVGKKKISKDTIKITMLDIENERIKKYADGVRDYDDTMKENPIEKIFATALTGAKNFEQEEGHRLFNVIKTKYKDESNASNLRELYINNNEFKDKVDSFVIKNVKNKGVQYEEFHTFIDDLLDNLGIEYKLQKSNGSIEENGRRELVNKTIKALRKKFLRLRSLTKVKTLTKKQTEYPNIEDNYYMKPGGTDYTKPKQTSVVEDAMMETPIRMKNLMDDLNKEGDIKYRLLQTNDLGLFDGFIVRIQGVEFKLNKFFTEHEKKIKDKKPDYFLPIHRYKFITDILNTKSPKDLSPEHLGILKDFNIKLYNKVSKKKVDTIIGEVGRTEKDEIVIDYSYLRKVLKERMGLGENEYIMGTLGDKSSFVQIYKSDKPTFNEVEKEFTEEYIRVIGHTKGDQGMGTIIKRESAMASTTRIFEGITDKTTTYIVKELKIGTSRKDAEQGITTSYNKEMNGKLADFFKRIKESKTIKEKENILNEYKDFFKEYDDYSYLEKSTEDILTDIDTVYNASNRDGAGFASDDISELANELYGFDGSDGAWKYHIVGNVKSNGNEGVYMAKINVNKGTVKKYDKDGGSKVMNRTYVIDKSGLKLGKELIDITEAGNIIEVNGIKMVIEGKIDDTDLSHAVNAKDKSKKKDEQAIGTQIINLLGYKDMEYMTSLTKEKITNFVEKELQSLGILDETMDIYGDVGEWLTYMNKAHNIGGASDTIINTRLDGIIQGVKKIIKKGGIEGTNPVIQQSTIFLPKTKIDENGIEKHLRLKRDEVVVAKNGTVHKNALKTLKKEIRTLEEQGTSISETDRKRLTFLHKQRRGDVPLQIYVFRNPVPNKENTGVYKIRFAEDVGLNKRVKKTGKVIESKQSVKSNDIIGHPESIFFKLQADFDADTVISIPLASRESMVLANSAIKKGRDDLYDALENDYKNPYVLVEQIGDEKPKTKIKEEVKSSSILDARNKNVEAKETVSPLFSTTKVFNTLLQIVEKHADKKTSILEDKTSIILTKDFIDTETTLGSIFKELFKLNGDKGITKGEDYSGIIASLAQLVLDYAKSKSDKFPKEIWLSKALHSIGITEPAAQKYFYNDVVSLLALTFNNPNKELSINKIEKIMKSKKGKDNISYNITGGSLGYVRNLTEFFLNKYGDTLVNLKQHTERDYIVESFSEGGHARKLLTEEIKVKQVKIVDKDGKLKTEDREEYILNDDDRRKLFNQIDIALEYSHDFKLADSTLEKIKKLFNPSEEEQAIQKSSDELVIKKGKKVKRSKQTYIELDNKYKEIFEDAYDYNKNYLDIKNVRDKIDFNSLNERTKYKIALLSLGYGNRHFFGLLNTAHKFKYINYAARNTTKSKESYLGTYNPEYIPEVILQQPISNKEKIQKLKESIEYRNQEIQFNEELIKELALDIEDIKKQESRMEENITKEMKENLERYDTKIEDLKGEELIYKDTSVEYATDITNAHGQKGSTQLIIYEDPKTKKSTALIKIDKEETKKGFKKKVWTDNTYADPLPVNKFKTIESWERFSLEHERMHQYIKRLEGESERQYENRINDAALVNMEKTQAVVKPVKKEKRTKEEYKGLTIIKDGEVKTIKEVSKKELDKKLENLFEDQNKIILSEDKKNYVNTETGQTYDRVTTYTREKFEAEHPDYLEKSRSVGLELDKIIKDYFGEGVKDFNEYIHIKDQNQFDYFIYGLDEFKKELDKRGEKVSGTYLKVHSEKLGIAGELDLLTVKKNGDVTIYDIASKRDFKRISRLGEDFQNQISMYTHLLQDQHNINVSEIKVLPIHAHYKQPTDNLDELIVYQTQTIDKKSLENIKDYRKAETIDISSTQSSDMPLDSEMIVYEDTIKTDNAQEESLYNSIEEIESENKSLNEDNIKSVNGIEILKDTSKTKTVQKTKEEKIKDKQIFDYTTKLDISYKMRGHELKALSNVIDKTNTLDILLKEGVKTKVEQRLSSFDEESTFYLTIFRESVLGGTPPKGIEGGVGQHSKGNMIKKKHLIMTKDFINDLNKAGLSKEQIAGMHGIIDQPMYAAIQKTNKGFIFNKELYLKGVVKKIETYNRNDNKTKLEDLNEEHLEIIKEYAKKLTDTNKAATPDGKGVLEMDGLMYTIIDSLNNVNHKLKDLGGLDLSKYSKKDTFFTDLIGMFSGDMEFYYRMRGVKTEKGFKDYLIGRMAEEGRQATDGEKKVMSRLYNHLYNKDQPAIIKGIKELQGGYYFWSYQSGSIALGGMGHAAAMTQALSNGLELLSQAQALGNKQAMGDELVKGLGLYAESTAGQGQGIDAQLTKTLFQTLQKKISSGNKIVTDKIMKELGVKDAATRNAISNVIDTIVTEPLFAIDMINDPLRRKVSALHVMEATGHTNVNELIAWSKLSERNEKQFKALFYRKYNELGGGVISTSGVYRDPMFLVRDWMPAKIFLTSYRFLNGWGLHKVATLGEKMLLPMAALNAATKGDWLKARQYFGDFINYTHALGYNILMAAGIAMRLQKHDFSDKDEKTQMSDAIFAMTNTLTAIDITISREKKNWDLSEGYDTSTRMGAVGYGLMEHMLRYLKPAKIVETTIQRREMFPEENMLLSVHEAMKANFSAYLRYGYSKDMPKFYTDPEGMDNLQLLGYNQMNPRKQYTMDTYKKNKIMHIDSVNDFSYITTMLNGFISSKSMNDEVLIKYTHELQGDKDLQKLKEHGFGKKGYDLNKLMLTKGKLDYDYVNKLFDGLVTYPGIGARFDKDGRKLSDRKDREYDTKMDDYITNALNDLGITKENFINDPRTRVHASSKLMHELSHIKEFSARHLVSYVGYNKYSELTYEAKEELKDQGITDYKQKKLTKEEEDGYKAKAMKWMQESGYLDLNLENHGYVQGLHTEKYHSDLMDRLNKGKLGNSLNNAMNMLLYSSKNMEDGDTDAKIMKTVYAIGLKSVGNVRGYDGKKVELSKRSIEDTIDITNKILYTIDDTSSSTKEKIVKQAAALTFINSELSKRLRDNDVFNGISKQAQRQLMSWNYKVNNDLLDFDENSIINSGNKNTFKKRGSFSNSFRNGMKSPHTSGARPGFAKQFPEIGQFIKGKEIPHNYKEILDYNKSKPLSNFNYQNFPTLVAFREMLARELYKDVVSGTEAKIKIRTKKSQPKTSYVKTTKKKARLGKKGRARLTQPKYKRSTTIKGLPGDLITKAF